MNHQPVLQQFTDRSDGVTDLQTGQIEANPSFGHGIHSCLGAPLARLEAKIALSTLFERLDKIERVPDGALEAVVSPFSYGMKCLPITFKRK